MNYDHWKATNPTDEQLGPEPTGTDESERKPPDVGAENIEQAMALCSRALVDVFEECAKRYESAIEAEEGVHKQIVETLKENAAKCREQGQQSSRWLKGRAVTAGAVVANAASSLEALQTSRSTP